MACRPAGASPEGERDARTASVANGDASCASGLKTIPRGVSQTFWYLPSRTTPTTSSVAPSAREAASDGAPIRPELFGQRFVHNHHRSAIGIVPIVKRPPLDRRHARGNKVIRADVSRVDRRRPPVGIGWPLIRGDLSSW